MSKVIYGVYQYGSNPNGKAGLAEFANGKVSRVGNLVSDLSPDPRVFSYKNTDKKIRLLVSETFWVNNVAQPSKLTTYTENLEKVGNLDQTVVSGVTKDGKDLTVSNVHAVAPEPGYFSNGGIAKFLCLIDYDQHAVFGIPVISDKFYPKQAQVYEYTPKTGDKGYGEDLLTDGQYIYALFVSAKDAWHGDYSYYSLVRLNGDLKEDAKLHVKTYNPFSLQKYGDNLYVTSVGGMQQSGKTNGTESKIERIPLTFNGITLVKPALVGGDDATTGDFRALAFSSDNSDSTDAYVLTGHLTDAGTGLTGALHYLTMDDLKNTEGKTIDEVELASFVLGNVSGYNWGLLYSEKDKAVWFTKGNDLGVYQFDGEAIKERATIAIDDMAGSTGYSLNTVALVGEGKNFKGYVSPTFASVSKRAIEEREKLLK